MSPTSTIRVSIGLSIGLAVMLCSCRKEPRTSSNTPATPDTTPLNQTAVADTEFIWFPKRHAAWIETYSLNDIPGYPYYHNFRDSIFVSDEKVILRTRGANNDTVLREYSVLKVLRMQQKRSDTVWENRGIFNYGAIREDSASATVHAPLYDGVTSPPYPSTLLFRDVAICEFGRKSGVIRTEWFLTSPTRVVTEKVSFGGRYLERQFFLDASSGDTVGTYTQPTIYRVVNAQAQNALPNTILSPNSIHQSTEFRYKSQSIFLFKR